MVAHTGFLFTARRLADHTQSIRRGEEPLGDLDPRDGIWEDPNLSYEAPRHISAKKLRKVIRDTKAKAAGVGLDSALGESFSNPETA